MLLKKYSDCTIDVLQATPDPSSVILTGLQNCFHQDVDVGEKKLSKKLVQYLLDAEHTSVLEHAVITIFAMGMSRSLLAQITRQRTFSFSSSSQHYQDYRNYPQVVHADNINNPTMIKSIGESVNSYVTAINEGVKPEEARQVLPNSAGVNLLVTTDARNLMFFFRARMCLRNTSEMLLFARKWHGIACNWFPELFKLVGPPCSMNKTNSCTQGHLEADSCKRRRIKDGS